MSTPMIERLSAQFTTLIGPEAFAKAAAAAAAAKAAAAEAAKVAAAKAAAAAAAAAAAKAATPAPAKPNESLTASATKPSAPATPVSPVAERVSVSPPAAKPSESLAASATKPAAPMAPPAPATAVKPATPAAAAARPAAAPAPAAPALPPIPPPPLQTTDFAQKGYHLDATVAPQQVSDAARLLDAQGFALDAITGVDWMAQNEMEVVYDFFHPVEATRVVVRTRVPRATPELPTIVDVFPGANWHERETHDFFGIRFAGHPNLKPFLLPEDANFHPLRKDYAP